MAAFSRLTEKLDLGCPLYFARNDGTLIKADEVKRLSVMTFACGPTNSMRGAAFLSGQKDALVVDIGGTTTDVGEVCGGFADGALGHVNDLPEWFENGQA